MSNQHSPHHDRQGDASTSPVDLHAHTTASDGTLEAELVDPPPSAVCMAWRHRSRHGRRHPRDTPPGRNNRRDHHSGVELPPPSGARGPRARLRCRSGRPVVADALASLATARLRRIEQMIESCAMPTTTSTAMILTRLVGSIGRPHVARALIAIGAVESIDDAFRRFHPGTPGWVPRESFTPEQAVGLLVAHDAVPVLAHPFSTGDIAGVLGRLADRAAWHGGLVRRVRRAAARTLRRSRGNGIWFRQAARTSMAPISARVASSARRRFRNPSSRASSRQD